MDSYTTIISRRFVWLALAQSLLCHASLAGNSIDSIIPADSVAHQTSFESLPSQNTADFQLSFDGESHFQQAGTQSSLPVTPAKPRADRLSFRQLWIRCSHRNQAGHQESLKQKLPKSW